jgi:hypothetical protein
VVAIGATAVAFAVIIGVVLTVSRQRAIEAPPSQPSLPDASRAGSPEFEAYRQLIHIESEPEGSENLLGQVLVAVKGILRNRGDRTLTGVEVRAVVLDADGNQIGDRIATPVPRQRPQLGPGESMLVQVRVDNVPAGANPVAARLELSGLRFGASPEAK